MRRRDGVPCALLAILLSCGSPAGNAQPRDDLLNIPWGTGLDRMRDRFTLVPLDSDSVSLRYSADAARAGGVRVEECILEFRGTAFSGAAVFTRGRTNSRDLLASLFRTFGPGRKENPRAYQWLSETTHVFYDEDSDGDSYVYWYSRKLSAGISPARSPAHRNPPAPGEDR